MHSKSSPGAAKTPDADEGLVAKRAAQIRLALIVVAVLAVLGLGLAIFLAVREESAQERWDVLEELRTKYEPAQDPIWENPYGVYNPERERYIATLEKFLDTKAKEEGDALAPHTRFLLAKTLADHILSNPNMLDRDKRETFYRKGIAQLEAIRDQYPDFPLNWTSLSPEGFPSLTRQFIDWFGKNEAWEAEHLLRAKEPGGDVRVLIRTERGDLLLGLYAEDAPLWTQAFLERASRGAYDGTAFSAKEEVGDVTEPEKHYVRAGDPATRGLANFDVGAYAKATSQKTPPHLLLEEARNRIPHERGIVAAWHAAGEEYDNEAQFIVEVRRSPMLDYAYTPIGKLVDEQGVDSLLTLDRIFGGTTWRDDDKVRADTDKTALLDGFQAPVKIVKVLVYDKGTLRAAGTDALSTKSALDESEKTLGTLQIDRYKVEPPVRPLAPKDEVTPPKDGGEGPKDDDEGPKDDDAKAPDDDK